MNRKCAGTLRGSDSGPFSGLHCVSRCLHGGISLAPPFLAGGGASFHGGGLTLRFGSGPSELPTGFLASLDGGPLVCSLTPPFATMARAEP